MSVVYGRENDKGKIDRFGVSGYTHKNTFLIFDRETESLWYPMSKGKWTAISGPRKGEEIAYDSEPTPMPLGQWRKEHPNTLVLLGSKKKIEERESEDESGA